MTHENRTERRRTRTLSVSHWLKPVHADDPDERLRHLLRLSGQARIGKRLYDVITGGE